MHMFVFLCLAKLDSRHVSLDKNDSMSDIDPIKSSGFLSFWTNQKTSVTHLSHALSRNKNRRDKYVSKAVSVCVCV